jgi:eukaryotic-like serine/threonine-protein kinase
VTREAVSPQLRGPELPQRTFVSHLGSGGFADVYLYRHLHVPGLEQAVKVLKDDALDDEVRASFIAEAATMAELSGHPSIVSIVDVGFTDDGRPYLVMDYYSEPNLEVRARSRPSTVREVLELGVQLGGAVESAHRAGILHRDIKPANILTDKRRQPALTDFGIASRTEQGGSAATGMSVPWSPPEVIEWLESDGRADVYSLGATLWHLLGGHSPFWVPGGSNTRTAMTDRVKREPVPALPRDDVPESLQRLLRRTMAKDPAARPATALEFAYALRAIEQELRLPVTSVKVDDLTPATAPLEHDDEAPKTVVRRPAVISPDGPDRDAAQTSRRQIPTPRLPLPPAAGGPAAHEQDGATTHRRVQPDPEPFLSGSEQSHGDFPRPAGTPTADRRVPRRREGLPGPVALDRTSRRSTPIRPDAVDVAQPPRGSASPDDVTQSLGGRGPRRTAVVAALAAAVAVAAGVLVALVLGSGATDGDATDAHVPATTTPGAGQDALAGSVPSAGVAPGVPVVTASREAGGVRFTWTYSDPSPGDSFRWTRGTAGTGPAQRVDEATVLVPSVAGQPVCLSVRAVRANGLASASSPAVCR